MLLSSHLQATHPKLTPRVTSAGSTHHRNRESRATDRHTDPAGWVKAVYSEDIIVTRVDEDGHAIRFCSTPSMAITMLDLAGIQPGHTVLKFGTGTGTGWTSALMAWRLGGQLVTTVEADPDLAEQARRNHVHARIRPTVITGDGTAGLPARAPYDRVISTSPVARVPYAWLEQTRHGGIVLTPLNTPFAPGALLRLTVNGDGTAAGQFVHDSSFMVIRDQRFSPHAVTQIATQRQRETISVDKKWPLNWWAILGSNQ